MTENKKILEKKITHQLAVLHGRKYREVSRKIEKCVD